MQETNRPQSGGGKLDAIMNIKSLLPQILTYREKCQTATAELEKLLVEMRDAKKVRDEEQRERVRREEKEKEYEDYKNKINKDRESANKRIDTIISGRTERAPQNVNAREPQPRELQRQPQPVQTPAAKPPSKMSGQFGRPGEPDAFFVEKQRREQERANRPRFQNNYPNNNYQNNGQRNNNYNNNNNRYGDRPPAPRFGTGANFNAGNRPQGRTWTPQMATANGYGSKQVSFQRDYRQGQGYTGYTPRPQFAGQRQGGYNNGGYNNNNGGAGLPKPTERFMPKVNTFDNNKRKGKGHTDDDRAQSQISQRALLRRGIIEEQEIEERMLTRIFKTKKSKENANKDRAEKPQAIIIDGNDLTVKTLSEKIGKPVNQIIKQLMVLGQMCAINSIIDFDTAELVSGEFGIKIEKGNKKSFEEQMEDKHKYKQTVDTDENAVPRPPVVTIMGHVDHGKTTLLDYLRHSNVVAGESGGITQHIGAYQVEVADGRKITVLDTPGHAAFDKMRARGAKITDIAILIVAGDDGVMPQTIEAINHIQSQNLPMIVAVNKCDKPEFDIEKVRTQLSVHNVIGEEWGGSAIIVPISAKTGKGIDKLLEMILLVADMNNYRANFDKEASGAIIESKMDLTKGPIVTVLVQHGTLKVGDTLLAGTTYGKVRAMKNDAGKTVKIATPSVPVQISGFTEVPTAGIDVYAVDEKLTKQVIAERKGKEKTTRANMIHTVANFDPFAEMSKTEKKQLRIILKADVSGSLEAIEQSINNITSEEVTISIISRGVGMVNDNDIDLATVTGALVIAFNTKTVPTASKLAEKSKVKIYNYSIIYEIFDFITEQMVRLFSPKFETEYYGRAEVRALFKSSAIGQIAGCMVLDGKVLRNATVVLKRADAEIGKYLIDSLKIKTEDMKEVTKGNECGIKLKSAPELLTGDIMEVVGERQLPIIFNGKEYKF